MYINKFLFTERHYLTKISQTLSSRILNFNEKRKKNHLTKPRQTWLAGPLEMFNSSASVEGSTSGAQVTSAVWQTGERARRKETSAKCRPIHHGLSLKPLVTTLKVHVLQSLECPFVIPWLSSLPSTMGRAKKTVNHWKLKKTNKPL